MISHDDDRRPSHEPQRVEAEERIVEPSLLRIVLQSEECRVDEHTPARGAEDDQTVAGQGFVAVEDLSTIS